MLINELAKRTGVTIYTLRYYENIGLITGAVNKSVTTNTYRNYDESIVDKVALIKDAKEVGFTLAEVKFLLESWNDDKLSIGDKVAIFNAKIKEIEVKIRHLGQVKKKLINTVKDIENGDC